MYYFTAYDRYTGRGYYFEVESIRGYYTIYLDGEFFCSVDNRREAEDEIEAFVKENNLSWTMPF